MKERKHIYLLKTLTNNQKDILFTLNAINCNLLILRPLLGRISILRNLPFLPPCRRTLKGAGQNSIKALATYCLIDKAFFKYRRSRYSNPTLHTAQCQIPRGLEQFNGLQKPLSKYSGKSANIKFTKSLLCHNGHLQLFVFVENIELPILPILQEQILKELNTCVKLKF